MEEKLIYCSFCGASQHEVRKMIAGPKTFICNECVDLCDKIIREESDTASLSPPKVSEAVVSKKFEVLIKILSNFALIENSCQTPKGIAARMLKASDILTLSDLLAFLTDELKELMQASIATEKSKLRKKVGVQKRKIMIAEDAEGKLAEIKKEISALEEIFS